MPTDDHDLRQRLEHFLTTQLQADTVRITTLSRSTEGFSQETFSFDVAIIRDGARATRGYEIGRAHV